MTTTTHQTTSSSTRSTANWGLRPPREPDHNRQHLPQDKRGGSRAKRFEPQILVSFSSPSFFLFISLIAIIFSLYAFLLPLLHANGHDNRGKSFIIIILFSLNYYLQTLCVTTSTITSRNGTRSSDTKRCEEQGRRKLLQGQGSVLMFDVLGDFNLGFLVGCISNNTIHLIAI